MKKELIYSTMCWGQVLLCMRSAIPTGYDVITSPYQLPDGVLLILISEDGIADILCDLVLGIRKIDESDELYSKCLSKIMYTFDTKGIGNHET